jgi:hypothetical protein
MDCPWGSGVYQGEHVLGPLQSDGGCKEVIRKLQSYASIKGIKVPLMFPRMLYIQHVEILKKRCKAVGPTFRGAIKKATRAGLLAGSVAFLFSDEVGEE